MSIKEYHQYQNYSAMSAKTEEPVVEEAVTPVEETAEVVETVEEESVEVIEEPVVEVKEDPVVEEPKAVIGVVSGCAKLRVRKAANTDADVVCEIDAGSEVEIDEAKSTFGFYKVCTAAGFEGFCMKKFITKQ